MIKKILILCTGNSCRSQMAQGILKLLDKELYVKSAGTRPAESVNPSAIRAMDEIGIDISQAKPTHVSEYANEEWDYVISVCGDAKVNCPTFVGKVGKRLHIGFSDPKGQDIEIFRSVRDQIQREFTKFYLTEIMGLTLPKCDCED